MSQVASSQYISRLRGYHFDHEYSPRWSPSTQKLTVSANSKILLLKPSKQLYTHTLIRSILRHCLAIAQLMSLFRDLCHIQIASTRHSYRTHHSSGCKLQVKSLKISALSPRVWSRRTFTKWTSSHINLEHTRLHVLLYLWFLFFSQVISFILSLPEIRSLVTVSEAYSLHYCLEVIVMDHQGFNCN